MDDKSWLTSDEAKVDLRPDKDYGEIGSGFEIAPSLAYFAATGLAPDQSDVLPNGEPHLLSSFEESAVGSANSSLKTEQQSVQVEDLLKTNGKNELPITAAWSGLSPEDAETASVVAVLARSHNLEYFQKRLEVSPSTAKGRTTADHTRRLLIAELVRRRLTTDESLERPLSWPMVNERLPREKQSDDQAQQREQRAAKILEELRAASVTIQSVDEVSTDFSSAFGAQVISEDRSFLAVTSPAEEPIRMAIGQLVEVARKQAVTDVDEANTVLAIKDPAF